MYNLMQSETVNFIANVFVTLGEEQINDHEYLAESIRSDYTAIKKFMDRRFGPPWHCIVGKGFGAGVTHQNKNFLMLYISNKAIMIFRH